MGSLTDTRSQSPLWRRVSFRHALSIRILRVASAAAEKMGFPLRVPEKELAVFTAREHSPCREHAQEPFLRLEL